MRELIMDKITYLSKNLNEFFNKKADEISITVGFIKRKRKMKGSSFVKAMILGNMGDGNCSIDGICHLLREDLVEITKQGLNFRFTEEAVEFMKKMYNESLVLFKNKLQVDCDILKQFKNVKLLDSSCIYLPDSMENVYKGCGGNHESNNTKSRVKLQLVFEYLNQVLCNLSLTEGTKPDQSYKDHLSVLDRT